MSNSLNAEDTHKNKALKNQNYGVVDTSLLFEEFRRQFRSTNSDIEINFRKVTDWVKLGDQHTHQIHPYPAKLLPHIAHFFTNASSLIKPNSIVLDPFCGSGTVALEATLANKSALFADANPLARLITKVKTTPYDPKILRFLTIQIIKSAARYQKAPIIEVLNAELWYSRTQKQKLEKVLRAILLIESEEIQEFFKVCFSVLVRRFSYADPSISVPVRLKEKEKFSNEVNEKIAKRLRWIDEADPIAEFYKICEINIYRVEVSNTTNPNRKTALFAGTDARKLEPEYGAILKNNSVSLTITSPPYGSAQKYIRSTSLSLNWLGLASVPDLVRLESLSIGREHIPVSGRKNLDMDLGDEYESVLLEIAKINTVREAITRTYLTELSDAVAEISRVTEIDGHVVMVVGNNTVSGKGIRNDKFLVKEFAKHNLTLEASFIDNIKSRGLMTKRNKTASVISSEHILVFRKSLPYDSNRD